MKINKLNFKKGFTLIELLVVVAIIGVLSAIVLASLQKGRGESVDAAIISELASLKNQAAIYASNNSNSFNNMFTSNNTWVSTDSNINAILVNLDKKSTVHTAGSSVNAWAAQVRSIANTNNYLCIDANLVVKEGTAVMAAGTTTCP